MIIVIRYFYWLSNIGLKKNLNEYSIIFSIKEIQKKNIRKIRTSINIQTRKSISYETANTSYVYENLIYYQCIFGYKFIYTWEKLELWNYAITKWNER